MKELLSKPAFLSLLGGVLLWAGWPTSPLFPLLFIGMALLLLAAKKLIDQEATNWIFFRTIYLGTFAWNVLTTWWIINSTVGGFVIAVFANSALMVIPFVLFRIAHRVKLQKTALIVFILSWLSYEYLHHNWSLNWPWITLGNGLAMYPSLIQWYEFTGTGGGSLWILVVNAYLYTLLHQWDGFRIKQWIGPVSIFLVPLLVSALVLVSLPKNPTPKTTEIVLLQPNFNTYTQKSRHGNAFIPYDEQIQKMIQLSKTQLTPETEVLVWPETAISGSNQESMFKRTQAYHDLTVFLAQYPQLTLIAGLDSYEICPDQKNPTEFASHSPYVGFYESYNSALMMRSDTISIYHKSKFVPGAERVPFPFLIKPLEILLGGVGFGHFFGQDHIMPFTTKHGIKVAPSICYESIFGEFITEFVTNGADIILISTNDDWWHDTQGHRQHYNYARLRAIETRRSIARSANTGTSGYIDLYGADAQASSYRETAVLRQQVALNSQVTFYTQHGDYIGRTSAYIAVLLIISLFVKRFTPNRK